MLQEITLEQFMEWLAYAELEPFGEVRDDYRSASVAHAVWNAALWANSSREHPFRERPLEEFLLRFGEAAGPRPRTQTWQEQKRIAELWVKAHNQQPK
jgi:hypothetical protein